jgi:hypothetical protein
LALPPISGQPVPAARPIADPRAAAQRAFFQAALGKASAPQAAAPPTQVAQPAAQPFGAAGPAPAAPPTDLQRPDRSARPGSLLNIVV